MAFLSSLRFRIVLWFIAILSGILILFSVLTYNYLTLKAVQDLDLLLLSRAEGIVSSVETYWLEEQQESMRWGASLKQLQKKDNLNFVRIARRWVEERTNDPVLANLVVDLRDAKGELIASSKYQEMLSLAALPFNGKNMQATYSFLKIKQADHSLHRYRVLTIPVPEGDHVAYVVRVGLETRYVDQALSYLKNLFLLLIPLTVFATGMLGAFLVRLTLKPVQEMTQTARQMTKENLFTRLPLPANKDEVYQLAQVFNSMLQRLEEDFVAQKQLMQDLTHELKTPLAILKGETEVVFKKERTVGEYRELLGSNLEEINRLIRLIDDLLLLARFENKTAGLNITSFYLNDLISEIIAQMSVLSDLKGITVQLKQQAPVTLMGDREQLRRVIMNLLDNAIKHTPLSGRIDVVVDRLADGIGIDINDTGAGIKEEDLKRIFERFYQADPSRHLSGAGLGLSIVRAIVQAHGGRIDVTSRLNEGTRFRIVLPN